MGMKKLKVMSIFGTRPEANKMAPVIQELASREAILPIVCVTAQHRQMLDQALEVFGIKPDYDLNIMTERQSLSGITLRALTGLEDVMAKEKPDLILVHGDTTTTFAGALAAFYSGVKVGHVEAGLRTYDKYQPYPEEINRKLTGALADIHFAPTQLSKEHLLKENTDPDSIFVTGNTSVDLVRTSLSDDYVFAEEKLNQLDFKNKRVLTMTAHRTENLGKPLESICHAVKRLADSFDNIEIVYGVHYNPAVRETVFGLLQNHPRIHLLDPPNMLDMHNLMNRSYLVLTDSGGLQEEAPGMHKPVIVLRNVTERPEGLEAGALKLAGTDEDTIFDMTEALLQDDAAYLKMANAKNPFGDGYAAKRIVDAILYYFGLSQERPEELAE